jgi:hypothetical protein
MDLLNTARKSVKQPISTCQGCLFGFLKNRVVGRNEEIIQDAPKVAAFDALPELWNSL